MAGFAVVVHRAGPAVPSEVVVSVKDALAPRGPDGVTALSAGRAVIIHAATHSTPEARLERQPYLHPSGTFYVADARVDNRSELMASLGWRRSPSETTDVELIAEAHQRWGADAAARLVGDFAFAAVGADGSVECYRDHMGVRPVHYWSSPHWLVVASDLAQVVAHPAVPRRMHVGLAGEYLSGIVDSRTRTIVEAVRRLPAAHGLRARTGLHTWEYWAPRLDEPLELAGPGEYEERFRELFGAAVTARLRSDRPVACHLSGGLDSTSIVAMASDAGHDVLALSCLFPGPRADERAYIDAAVRDLGVEWEAVVGDPDRARWVDGDVDRWADIPLPPDGPDHVELARRAHSRGGRVVLTGHGGDHWFDADPLVLLDLVTRGRLLDAWRTAGAAGDGTVRSTASQLVRGGLRPLTPRWVRQPGRRRAPWVAGDARGVARLDRRRVPGHLPRRFRRRTAQLLHEGNANGYEAMTRLVFDRIGAAAGVEMRHPYLDRRLMEFACRVPVDVHARPGRNRVLQRDALATLLPATVAERRSKARMSEVWWTEVQRHLPPDGPLGGRVAAQGWLDADETTAALARTRAAMDGPIGTGSLVGMWGIVQVESLLRLYRP